MSITLVGFAKYFQMDGTFQLFDGSIMAYNIKLRVIQRNRLKLNKTGRCCDGSFYRHQTGCCTYLMWRVNYGANTMCYEK